MHNAIPYRCEWSQYLMDACQILAIWHAERAADLVLYRALEMVTVSSCLLLI